VSSETAVGGRGVVSPAAVSTSSNSGQRRGLTNSGGGQSRAGADYRVPPAPDAGVPQVRGSATAGKLKPDATQRRTITIRASVLLIALGAVLLFAVTATVAGVSLNVVVGVVLIVAGAVDLLIALVSGGRREPI
jgi:hypothetical protein